MFVDTGSFDCCEGGSIGRKILKFRKVLKILVQIFACEISQLKCFLIIYLLLDEKLKTQKSGQIYWNTWGLSHGSNNFKLVLKIFNDAS